MGEGLRLAKERGALPDLAITHLRYAELLQQKGDLERAWEQLDKATELFRDMEMTWWLEQAGKLRDAVAAN